MEHFFIGLSLVLIIEGMLPFLSPPLWRRLMLHMLTQSNQTLRYFGFFSMMFGVGLLYWVH